MMEASSDHGWRGVFAPRRIQRLTVALRRSRGSSDGRISGQALARVQPAVIPATRRGGDRPRRLVTCLLAFSACLLLSNGILTASYLGAHEGGGNATASDQVVTGLVGRFYDAINAALVTGDTNPVAALLAPDFAEYPPRTGAPAGAAGLLAAISRIRLQAPDLRLHVNDVSALSVNQEVTVHVSATGTESGAFLGVPPPVELATWGWGPIEQLRLRNGLIAERWSESAANATLEQIGASGLPSVEQNGRWLIALLRLTLAPGAALPVANDKATRYLVVEAGTPEVTIYRQRHTETTARTSGGPVAEPSPVPADPPVRLVAGDDLLTVPAEHFMLANPSRNAAVLLVAVRLSAGGSMDGAAAFIPKVRIDPLDGNDSPAGISEDLLAIGFVAHAETETLALGRVVFAPGAILTWPVSERPMLFAVERGQLQLIAGSTSVSGLRADGESWTGTTAFVSAGDSAQIEPAIAMTWQPSGNADTVVYVLTLWPG